MGAPPIQISSFRRMPESSAFNKRVTDFPLFDETPGVPP